MSVFVDKPGSHRPPCLGRRAVQGGEDQPHLCSEQRLPADQVPGRRWDQKTVSPGDGAPGDVEVRIDDHFGRITAAETVYLVIMKSFNMKDVELKHTISRIGWKLEPDEHGRLFHPGLRAMFDPLKIELGAIEALSAVRFAGRSVHLLQERWAEQHGLSEGRLGVLFRLYRCGDMPLGDLANDLDSTPRNITGLVDHLEKDGLVERVPDATDRRSIHARLTAAGRERIESIWREGLERQFEMVEGMSKDDLAQLRHLCLLLVENARKELGK